MAFWLLILSVEWMLTEVESWFLNLFAFCIAHLHVSGHQQIFILDKENHSKRGFAVVLEKCTFHLCIKGGKPSKPYLSYVKKELPPKPSRLVVKTA